MIPWVLEGLRVNKSMNFAWLYIVTSKHITLALHSSFPGVRTRIQLNKIRFRKIYYTTYMVEISEIFSTSS